MRDLSCRQHLLIASCSTQELTAQLANVQQLLQESVARYGVLQMSHTKLQEEHREGMKRVEGCVLLMQSHPGLLKSYCAITQHSNTNTNTNTNTEPNRSSNHPANFDPAKNRQPKWKEKARRLWSFAGEFFGGEMKYPYAHGHEDADEEGKETTMLTGVEFEVINYITNKKHWRLVDVLLTHEKFRSKIAVHQRKAAIAHSKTEQQLSLSCVVASQVMLGSRKCRELHSRLCEEPTTDTGQCCKDAGRT